MKALLEAQFIQPDKKFLVAFATHGEEQSRWCIIASTLVLDKPIQLADTRHVPGTRVWFAGHPEDALKNLLQKTTVKELKEVVNLSDTTLTALRAHLGISQGTGRGGKRR